MEETSDPAFRRLIANIRRRWMLIAIAGLVGGALLALLGGSSQYEASARLRYVDNTGTLSASGLDPDPIQKSLSLALDVDAISGDVALQTHHPDHPTFTTNSDQQTVDISVTSSTSNEVQTALGQYIDLFRSHRAAQIDAVVGGIRASLAAQADAANARIAELDQLLLPLAPSQNVLANAYVVERNRLVTLRSDLAAQDSALTQYSKDSKEAVHVVLRTKTTASSPTLKNGLLGLVAGLFLSIGCIAALTYFDRRIRSRSDVEAIQDLRLLAIVTKADDTLGSVALATSLAAESDHSGRASFLFFATSRLPDSATFTNRVGSQLASFVEGAQVSLVGEPSQQSEALILSRSIPQVVLLVVWGQTKMSALLSAAKAFEAAGARVAGVAIVGVPAHAQRTVAD